jgi:hypothetical protein
MSSKAVLKELKKRIKAAENAGPIFDLKDHLFDKQLKFVNDPAKFKTAVCSRRCLAKGTLIQTVEGPKKIENITTKDWVYDEYGKPIKVIETFYNGEKEVFELLHNNKILAEATKDHVFLTFDTHKKSVSEKKITEFNSRTKIIRNEVDRNSGTCVKHALDVFVGNSRIEDTYDIHVASSTNLYMLANGLITHNSGKSESCAADLIFTCLENENVNCLYITLTRVSAKRIIWPIIKRVLTDYKIPIKKMDNQDLSIEFKNNSILYISGAKDSSEIERFRGMSLKKIYIDELQSFRSYIKDLIDDVLVPATWDVNGSLCLIGTPGPVPAGYFYECTHNVAWSNHKWNIYDNPWILKKSGKTPEEILKEERERKGITESDPSYQREALGLWAKDDNSLIFKFDKNKNITTTFPSDLTYIFGIDLGYNDADAIAVLGFNYKEDCVYLVEEVIKTKQTISSLVKEIKILEEKYKPIKMVMDAGALGKKIQEEIRQRHGIPVEAAAKERKFEFIELLNDDLRTGKFKTFPGSRFEEDCYLVQWNKDDPTKLVVSDVYHSDCHDSTLYSWKECKHYIPKASATVSAPNTTSDKYGDYLEEQEMKKFAESKDSGEWGVDQDELDSIFDIQDYNNY